MKRSAKESHSASEMGCEFGIGLKGEAEMVAPQVDGLVFEWECWCLLGVSVCANYLTKAQPG